VDWSWEGVSQVFAAWGIAPCVAACFGAILFTFTKYGVLHSSNPLKMGMITVPIYFAITSGILAMLIVWKGAASLDLDDWGTAPTVGTIFGVAIGVALLSIFFLLPFLYVRLVKEDWKIKSWDILQGPFLLKREHPGPIPDGKRLVPDYYDGHLTREELDEQGRPINDRSSDEESLDKTQVDIDAIEPSSDEKDTTKRRLSMAIQEKNNKENARANNWPKPQGKWYSPAFLGKFLVWVFFRGVMIDVVKEQASTNEPKGLQTLLVGKNLADKHARVKHYDPKVEHLFSFLQVMTAATASFAHGANDVANAMGPLSAIFNVWQTDTTGEDSPVPIWVLVYGGAAISIGCWTYGYNLIRNLGNRITLHSPCRGFCMELGAALTVVMATRLALPVSTTQ
jgi:solute carrier family 20 (sodium-dependent phosphate transporter)